MLANATGGDDAGMAAASTALGNLCATLELPTLNAQLNGPSIIGVTKSKFTSIATSCATVAGTDDLREGFTVHGGGQGSSTLLLWPEFDPTTCSNSAASCFGFVPTANNGDMIFRDFAMTGGGNGTCGSGFNGKTLIIIPGQNSGLFDFWAQGMCAGQSGVTGVTFGNSVAAGPITMSDSQLDGWGYNDALIQHTEFVNFSGNCFVGDVGGLSVEVATTTTNGGLYSTGCIYGPNGNNTDPGGGNIGCQVQVDLNGFMVSLQDIVNLGSPASKGFCNNGGTLYMDHDNVALATANGVGLYVPSGATTAVNFVSSSILSATGTTGTAIFMAAGLIHDQGFNTLTSNTINWGLTTNTTIDAPINSISGSCYGVATSSTTLGLYGNSPNVTAASCTSTAIGTGYKVKKSATVQALYVRSTAAGVSSSSGVVTVKLTHLGTTTSTAITCTIGTSTYCADNTHSFAVVPGDLIDFQFTTQAAETLAGVTAQVIWE